MNKSIPLPQAATSSRRWFHYTRASNFQKIAAAGFIDVSREFKPPGEEPAVWFSRREDYEPTALPGIIDTETGDRRTATFEELQELDSPVRIEVPVTAAPHNWPSFLRTSGITRAWARAMASTAFEVGANPHDWRVSFVPVPLEDCIGFEIFTAGRWQDMEQVFGSDQGGGEA